MSRAANGLVEIFHLDWPEEVKILKRIAPDFICDEEKGGFGGWQVEAIKLVNTGDIEGHKVNEDLSARHSRFITIVDATGIDFIPTRLQFPIPNILPVKGKPIWMGIVEIEEADHFIGSTPR